MKPNTNRKNKMKKSKPQSKSGRGPVCLLTKNPARKSGDKGVWGWSIVANGRIIAAQTELVCNRKHAVHAMAQTLAALAAWLAVEYGTAPADDGQEPLYQ